MAMYDVELCVCVVIYVCKGVSSDHQRLFIRRKEGKQAFSQKAGDETSTGVDDDDEGFVDEHIFLCTFVRSCKKNLYVKSCKKGSSQVSSNSSIIMGCFTRSSLCDVICWL